MDSTNKKEDSTKQNSDNQKETQNKTLTTTIVKVGDEISEKSTSSKKRKLNLSRIKMPPSQILMGTKSKPGLNRLSDSGARQSSSNTSIASRKSATGGGTQYLRKTKSIHKVPSKGKRLVAKRKKSSSPVLRSEQNSSELSLQSTGSTESGQHQQNKRYMHMKKTKKPKSATNKTARVVAKRRKSDTKVGGIKKDTVDGTSSGTSLASLKLPKTETETTLNGEKGGFVSAIDEATNSQIEEKAPKDNKNKPAVEKTKTSVMEMVKTMENLVVKSKSGRMGGGRMTKSNRSNGNISSAGATTSVTPQQSRSKEKVSAVLVPPQPSALNENFEDATSKVGSKETVIGTEQRSTLNDSFVDANSQVGSKETLSRTVPRSGSKGEVAPIIAKVAPPPSKEHTRDNNNNNNKRQSLSIETVNVVAQQSLSPNDTIVSATHQSAAAPPGGGGSVPKIESKDPTGKQQSLSIETVKAENSAPNETFLDSTHPSSSTQNESSVPNQSEPNDPKNVVADVPKSDSKGELFVSNVDPHLVVPDESSSVPKSESKETTTAVAAVQEAEVYRKPGSKDTELMPKSLSLETVRYDRTNDNGSNKDDDNHHTSSNPNPQHHEVVRLINTTDANDIGKLIEVTAESNDNSSNNNNNINNNRTTTTTPPDGAEKETEVEQKVVEQKVEVMFHNDDDSDPKNHLEQSNPTKTAMTITTTTTTTTTAELNNIDGKLSQLQDNNNNAVVPKSSTEIFETAPKVEEEEVICKDNSAAAASTETKPTTIIVVASKTVEKSNDGNVVVVVPNSGTNNNISSSSSSSSKRKKNRQNQIQIQRQQRQLRLRNQNNNDNDLINPNLIGPLILAFIIAFILILISK